MHSFRFSWWLVVLLCGSSLTAACTSSRGDSTTTAQPKTQALSGAVRASASDGDATARDVPAAAPGTSLGEASVDLNDGALDYRIGLPPLPARADFSPNLAIAYVQGDAAAGSGMGQGFGLELSAIGISTESGVPYPTVRTDTSDVMARLVIDGVRLIWEKVETVSEEGTSRRRVVYRPESEESFVRVSRYRDGGSLRYSSGGVDQVLNFKGFLVERPDGSKEVYTEELSEAEGLALPSGRTFPVRWPLKYKISPVGDRIEYEYEVDIDRRSYLRRVSFGGGRSEYLFARRQRRPPAPTYTFGFAQGNDSVYTRVQARFDGRTVSTMCWVYGAVSSDGPRLLTDPQCESLAQADFTEHLNQRTTLPSPERLLGVYEFGAGEGPFDASSPRESLLRLRYSSSEALDSGEGALVSTIQVPGVTGFGPSGGSQFVDMNSDGLPDIVGYAPAERQGLVAIHGGDEDQPQLFSRLPALTMGRVDSGVVRSSLVRFDEASSDDGIFLPGDYDGDGLTDFVMVTKESLNGKGRLWLGHGRPTGDALDNAVVSWLSDLPFTSFARGRATTEDLNADGRDDVLLSGTDGKSLTALVNTTARGTGTLQFVALANLGLPFVPTGPVNLADPAYRFQDVNADGLVDWVTLRLAGGGERGLCIYENRGGINTDPFTTGARAPSAATGPLVTERPGLLFGSNDPPGAGTCGAGRFVAIPGIGQPSLNGVWLIDVNRDGLFDLVNLSEERTYLDVWLAESATAFQPKRRLALGGASVNVDLENKWNTRVVDSDGDGAPEIVVFEREGGGRLRVIDFNRSAQENLIAPGLLISATDALGAEERFQYAQSSDEMVRDRRLGQGDGMPWVAAGITVLKRRFRGSTTSVPSVEEFRYHRPKWDPVRRWLGGFAQVEQLVHGATPEDAALTTTSFTLTSGAAARRLFDRPEREVVTAVTSDVPSFAELSSLPDPSTATASRSQETRQERAPRTARVLLDSTHSWQLSPANPTDDQIAYLRIDTETERAFDSSGGVSAKTIHSSFDSKFNRVQSVTTDEGAIAGPAGVTIPLRRRTERTEYDPAWEARGVVIARRRRTLSDETDAARPLLLEQTTWAYAPDRPLAQTESTLVRADLSGIPGGADSSRVGLSSEQLRTVRYEHDIYGNLVSATDDLGPRGRVGYDEGGLRPLWVEDALGRRTTYCYGLSNCAVEPDQDFDIPASSVERTHERLPTGRVSIVAYDARHRPVRARTFTGATADVQYEERPGQGTRVLSELRAEGSALRQRSIQAYDPFGQPAYVAEDDGTGRARISDWVRRDRRGNITFRSAPWLSSQTLEDVLNGTVAPIDTTCGRNGTCSSYDALDRELTSLSSDGRVARTMSYAAWGTTQIEVAESAQGPVTSTTTEVGRQGELLAAIDAAGNVTRFERDPWGNVRGMRLPEAPGETAGVRKYWVNSAGELLAASLASATSLGSSRVFLRDLRGRATIERTFSTDGTRWTQVERDLDAANRVLAVRSTKSEQPGAAMVQEFRYDRPTATNPELIANADDLGSLGQLVEQVAYDPRLGVTVTERYRHDLGGRVIDRRLQIEGSTSYAGHESWVYGADGMNQSYVDVFGNGFFPRFDSQGQLTELRWRTSGAERLLLAGISRNAYGQVEAFDNLPARTHHLWTHQAETGWLQQSMLCRLGGPCDASAQLAPNGPIAELPLVHRFARRGDSLLESETDEAGRLSTYRYDGRGALIAADNPDGSYRYQYDPRGQLTGLDEGSGVTMNSGVGDVPSLPPASGYVLDDLGRIVRTPKYDELSYGGGGELQRVAMGSTTVDYAFTAGGARVAKRVVTPSGVRWVFYPGNDQVDDGAHRVHRIGLDGRAVGLVRDETEVRALDLDHRGGVTAVVTAQSVDYRARYTPYGASLAPAAEDAELLGPFAEQSLDPDTGLVHMGAREYVPELGVFSTPDPLIYREPEACVVEPGACNPYAYAGLDPVNYVDPSGENPLAVLMQAVRARMATRPALTRMSAGFRAMRQNVGRAAASARASIRAAIPHEFSSRQHFATAYMNYAYGGVTGQMAREAVFERLLPTRGPIRAGYEQLKSASIWLTDLRNKYLYPSVRFGTRQNGFSMADMKDSRDRLRVLLLKQLVVPTLQKVLDPNIRTQGRVANKIGDFDRERAQSTSLFRTIFKRGPQMPTWPAWPEPRPIAPR